MLTLKDKRASNSKDEKERNPELMESINKPWKVKKSSARVRPGPGEKSGGNENWKSMSLQRAPEVITLREAVESRTLGN